MSVWPAAAQAGDEGLGLPATEGGVGRQATAAQVGHGHRRLVDEHQARGTGAHAGPALLDPAAPSLTNVGARLLRGHQGFFYM
ncbi:MAG TPA: hypothetical protein VN157_10135 [Caulobacter sp.]|nr:hypothetical protein [Caulobacter sp.]